MSNALYWSMEADRLRSELEAALQREKDALERLAQKNAMLQLANESVQFYNRNAADLHVLLDKREAEIAALREALENALREAEALQVDGLFPAKRRLIAILKGEKQ